MHFGTCGTLQARGFVEMQGEECGLMLCKILENLLYFGEVAGGASVVRVMQTARLG